MTKELELFNSNGILKKDTRARLLRLASGRFDVDDISQIYLALRFVAPPKSSVTDIAHFVAHRYERDRGFANRFLECIYVSANTQVCLGGGMKVTKGDMYKSARAGFEVCSDEDVRRELSISKHEAGLILNALIESDIIRNDPIGGQFDLRTKISDLQGKVLTHFVCKSQSKSLFLASDITEDLRKASRELGLISKEESRNLSHSSDAINLFVISILHGSTIRLERLENKPVLSLQARLYNKKDLFEVRAIRHFIGPKGPCVVDLPLHWMPIESTAKFLAKNPKCLNVKTSPLRLFVHPHVHLAYQGNIL